uniref:Uncharacterized protein n=1 Tax=Ditylum brightwellii TaxID=49249 RepID=A0A7S4R4V1_9STRA
MCTTTSCNDHSPTRRPVVKVTILSLSGIRRNLPDLREKERTNVVDEWRNMNQSPSSVSATVSVASSDECDQPLDIRVLSSSISCNGSPVVESMPLHLGIVTNPIETEKRDLVAVWDDEGRETSAHSNPHLTITFPEKGLSQDTCDQSCYKEVPDLCETETSGNSTVNDSSSAYDEYQDKVSALHVGRQLGRLFDENRDMQQPVAVHGAIDLHVGLDVNQDDRWGGSDWDDDLDEAHDTLDMTEDRSSPDRAQVEGVATLHLSGEECDKFVCDLPLKIKPESKESPHAVFSQKEVGDSVYINENAFLRVRVEVGTESTKTGRDSAHARPNITFLDPTLGSATMEEVVLRGQLGSPHHFQDNNGFIGYDEDDACSTALTGCTVNRDSYQFDSKIEQPIRATERWSVFSSLKAFTACVSGAAMYCNEDVAHILIDEVSCTSTIATW